MAKALILVGGYGTRLRPLTLSCPKPIVEFANKPMVIHQIEALKEAGVEEVILAINYRPEAMLSFTQEWSKKLGITISISRETEPMGTAGPLALAREKLAGDKPFFVLNSDVICDYPLKEMLAFHTTSGAEATMLVTKVDDPSKYGVVIHDAAGKIDRFVEKPKEFVGDEINAGIYILSPSVLDRIELRPTSIEREVFPAVAADGKLFAFLLPGFWMDVGQPKDFLKGLHLYLDSLRNKAADKLASGKGIKGNVLVDATAKIGENCLLGPDVCIGPGAVIGDGVRLSNCVIMREVAVKNYAKVDKSIIGWESVLGSWSRVEGFSVLGEDVTVRDEVFATGAVVLPHKEVKENVESPKIIL